MLSSNTCRFIFCFLLAGQAATAQYKWGIKGGINVANGIYTGPLYSYSAIRMNGGFWGTMELGENFFLQAELQYSQKGNLFQPTDITHLFENSILRLNYLTLPILAGLRVGKKWEFLLGPEVGFLLRAIVKDPDYPDQNLTDRYRRFDLGAAAGLRYHLSSKWGVEFRYILGLIRTRIPVIRTELYSNTTPPTSNGYTDDITPNSINPYNQVFQFDVFFRIGR